MITQIVGLDSKVLVGGASNMTNACSEPPYLESILNNISLTEYEIVLGVWEKTILATDLRLHFQLLHRMFTLAEDSR